MMMMIKKEMNELLNMESDSDSLSRGSSRDSRDSFQLTSRFGATIDNNNDTRNNNINISNNNNNIGNTTNSNNNNNNNRSIGDGGESDDNSQYDGSRSLRDNLRRSLSRDSADSEREARFVKRPRAVSPSHTNELDRNYHLHNQQQHLQFSQQLHLHQEHFIHQAQHSLQAAIHQQQQQHLPFQYPFSTIGSGPHHQLNNNNNNNPFSSSSTAQALQQSPHQHLLQTSSHQEQRQQQQQDAQLPYQTQHQHQEQKPQPTQQQQGQTQSQSQSQSQQLGPDGKPKRNPYCSRCRNHGKSAQVKGHKRHCEYRDCQCEGCKLVECRQIVSAAQIKRRRYQKQDEECGRRIEISPPVLTRAPNSDPAALIAKTLISGSSGKHNNGSSTKQLAAAMAAGVSPLASHTAQHQQQQQQQHQHQQERQLQIMKAAAMPAFLSAAVAASSAPAPSLATTTTTSQQQMGGEGPSTSHIQGGRHPGGLSSAAASHQLALGQLQQNPAGGLPALLGGVGGPPTSLSEALHLFQFPSSIFTAAFAQQQQQQQPQHLNPAAQSLMAAAAAAASSTTSAANLLMTGASGGDPSSSASSSSSQAATAAASLLCPGSVASASLPVIREQFSLVEEIHRTYGSLAVFAWLRAEGFNVAKVRALIDLSKVSFDELLQINGHSPLDLTSPIVD